MTESKSDTPATKPAAPASTPPASQAGPATASKGTPASGKKGVARSPVNKKQLAWATAFIVVVLVAVALAGGLWFQYKQFKAVNARLTGQVQSGLATASQASQQARQALENVQQQSSRLSALRTSLEASQEQLHTLEQTLQGLTDGGSDAALVNDIDHIVTIADQQLTLNGNVSNAIVALESAQARLARANRPGLASLQQTINGDLDNLRAVSVVDVSALTGQLDQLGTLVGKAALLVPDDAAPKLVPEPSKTPASAQSQPAVADTALPAWRRALDSVGDWSKGVWDSAAGQLRQLVSIRRVSDPAALLMSPDQARQLRENLRLRIMTAQLALMMHQPAVWKNETQALLQVLYTRYDSKDPRTRKAIHIATALEQTPVDVKLPTLENSLQALQALREQEAGKDDQPTSEEDRPPASGESQQATSDETRLSAEPSARATAPGTATQPSGGTRE